MRPGPIPSIFSAESFKGPLTVTKPLKISIKINLLIINLVDCSVNHCLPVTYLICHG